MVARMIAKHVCRVIPVVGILCATSLPAFAQDSEQYPQYRTSSVATLPQNQPESAVRPMNSIRLAAALDAKAIDGRPLKTPQDAAATMNAVPSEQHFTAAPWHQAHPFRNTFPVYHQPLYFENPNLERCGQSFGGLTEFVSATKFAAQISVLPMQVAAQPPCRTVLALPDCPTGGRFAATDLMPPMNARTVAFQTAVVIGLIFLIP